MKPEENYAEIFLVTNKECNVVALAKYQIASVAVSAQMKKYISVQNEDTVIGKISEEMAILITAHEVKCQNYFTIGGRASSDEFDATGRYNNEVVPLRDELRLIRDVVSRQLATSYPTYDIDYLALRKNGHLVKVKMLPAPPILTSIT